MGSLAPLAKPMKKPKVIDLNEAIQHPGKHLEFNLSTNLEEEEDLDLLEPVTGTLRAVSTGNMLLVDGTFSTRAVVECSRCLAPVEVSVDFEVQEEFPVEGVPAEMGGFAHVETDEPTPLFDGNGLLYEELLRQDLWLNLPTHPLCREDCPGIAQEVDDIEKERLKFSALSEILQKKEQRS